MFMKRMKLPKRKIALFRWRKEEESTMNFSFLLRIITSREFLFFSVFCWPFFQSIKKYTNKCRRHKSTKIFYRWKDVDEIKKWNNKRYSKNKTWHQSQLKTSFLIPFTHLACFVVFFTVFFFTRPALKLVCVCARFTYLLRCCTLNPMYSNRCAFHFWSAHRCSSNGICLRRQKRMNRNWTKASSRASRPRTKNGFSMEFKRLRLKKK